MSNKKEKDVFGVYVPLVAFGVTVRGGKKRGRKKERKKEEGKTSANQLQQAERERAQILSIIPSFPIVYALCSSLFCYHHE